MYIPTKCEKSVLEFFKKKQIKTLTKEQIADSSSGIKNALPALDGCVAKGYLTYSTAGYTLTSAADDIL